MGSTAYEQKGAPRTFGGPYKPDAYYLIAVIDFQ